MHARAGVLALGLVFLVSSAALAQAAPPPGAERRFVPGIVRQGGTFGDDHPLSSATTGITLGFQARRHPESRAGLTFEATLQPTAVQNPHFDERLRSIFAEVGFEIGRRIYVRPAGGVALQMWSGADAADPGFALVMSVAAGYRRHAGTRMTWAPEFVARSSASFGAWHWMLGVQVPIGWQR